MTSKNFVSGAKSCTARPGVLSGKLYLDSLRVAGRARYRKLRVNRVSIGDENGTCVEPDVINQKPVAVTVLCWSRSRR